MELDIFHVTSPVRTVSGVWGAKGKGVTCNGFCGLGGTREKVSHVTVSGGWEDKGKGVICNGFWVCGGWGKGQGIIYSLM